ncbi:MAG TPA: hypothetical protein VEG44_05985 [Candidatus Acidoferrales bacterium]|nr:hypothetical protein [Candidatus Acidoferrales bacterium]
MPLSLSIEEQYLVNQKRAALDHKIQHAAAEIEKEINQKPWDFEVEQVNKNEYKATLIVQEPVISIDSNDLVTYKGVPRKFAIRSPSLTFLLDSVERILIEQINEIKKLEI